MSTRSSSPPPHSRAYRRIKVLSLGDSGTGKSCLIKRYCEKKFIPKYISTIGVDFGVRSVTYDGEELRVNFWDLAGGHEYADVRREFYTNTQALMLVYDVTNPSSFAALEHTWLNECNKFNCLPYVTIVCANKCDEATSNQQHEKEARLWAQKKGFSYFETSAKTGQNVNELFNAIFKGVLASAPK